MENLLFKPGDIIKSTRWKEPVRIDKIDRKGQYLQIVGSYTSSHFHFDQLIDESEIKDIEIISSGSLFTAEAEKFFLAIETLRYRYASLYDPLLAVNISKIDPLPHQIDAVYGYVLKLPRIRFLIADDPGAGKTIMAGLIIKELKLRHIIKRILIVCPGHLKDQWKRELKEHFDESFETIDRSKFDEAYLENIWEKQNQIITSMDFAKRNEILQTLSATNFDLTIVDEAHKMSAYKYGEKTEKSERYKLGEVLSKISVHLLFLTATPHRGDPENFRLFLDLLEPGFFATKEQITESIQKRENPLFIRRIKEELKDFDGKPLFLPRHVSTVNFYLSEPERILYNDLSEYVANEYRKTLDSDKKRNISFALTILQRRFASSTHALLRSLERRKERLLELLKSPEPLSQLKVSILDYDELDDLSENERESEEKKWEALTVATNKDELCEEIEKLEELIHQTKEIIRNENESKLSKLKESLQELKSKYSDKGNSSPKVIIFTESRDTLEYLESKIKSWGYKVNTIHGGMKLEERVNAESVFRNTTEVLIATEAAGEGINLQFCNLMINYDIPWNPNRLEQRMGRIHRYGQTREVYIFNFVNTETREGKVLTRLFEKIEEIRNALGSDKVFDVLGDLIESKKVVEALIDAAVNARSIDEILKVIDFRVDEEYIRHIKEDLLGETIATRHIDYTLIKEMAQKAKENRLIPEYTQNYFIRVFEMAGNKKIEKNLDGTFTIKEIPYEIRKIADDNSFKRVAGGILKNYPRVTFDKDFYRRNPKTEFISFGHPLFEAVLRWVETFAIETLQRGAVFYDPDGKIDGYILFYEGEITDGSGNIAGKRIFSFLHNGKEVKPISPAIIWDLKGADGAVNANYPEPAEFEKLKEQGLEKAIENLKAYHSELLQERTRIAEIKQKYGVGSLEHLIMKLDSELVELYYRQQKGEKVELPIKNKEDQKKRYEMDLKELKESIEREKCLTMSTPQFIGAIRVIPHPQFKEIEPTTDSEIEARGMAIAMEYERNAGRSPEDVSNENIGYDIRSVDRDGNIRYIEVKARARVGDVALTQNEWFKAQRFGKDYYLYVIFNAGTDKPELYIISNPAENLQPEQKIEIVRYSIRKEDVVSKGEKA